MLRKFYASLSRAEFALILAISGVLLFVIVKESEPEGFTQFSPDTLEFKHWGQYRLLNGFGPPIRSGGTTISRNELTEFLIDHKYVVPLETSHPRWIDIAHTSPAWRDGVSHIHRELRWKRAEAIEWSKANPERAKLYWSEFFKLLRSNDRREQKLAVEILVMGKFCGSRDELQRTINEIYVEHKSR